jgi:magnesium chelatase subunit H
VVRGAAEARPEGVRQIEAQVTNTLGWSATTGRSSPGSISASERDLRARRRDAPPLAELNPQASARMANRLLEAFERNYWQPDDETLAALQAGADELEDTLEGLPPE